MSVTRTTVYSLDFDGCADVLFKALFKKFIPVLYADKQSGAAAAVVSGFMAMLNR